MRFRAVTGRKYHIYMCMCVRVYTTEPNERRYRPTEGNNTSTDRTHLQYIYKLTFNFLLLYNKRIYTCRIVMVFIARHSPSPHSICTRVNRLLYSILRLTCAEEHTILTGGHDGAGVRYQSSSNNNNNIYYTVLLHTRVDADGHGTSCAGRPPRTVPRSHFSDYSSNGRRAFRYITTRIRTTVRRSAPVVFRLNCMHVRTETNAIVAGTRILWHYVRETRSVSGRRRTTRTGQLYIYQYSHIHRRRAKRAVDMSDRSLTYTAMS